MTEENTTHDEMLAALDRWTAANESFIVQTPTGRYYGLFTEPDAEGPRMQYMGSSLVRAYAFVKSHPTNRYT